MYSKFLALICSFALFTKIKKDYGVAFSACFLYPFSIKMFLTLRSGSFPSSKQ